MVQMVASIIGTTFGLKVLGHFIAVKVERWHHGLGLFLRKRIDVPGYIE